MSHPDLMAAVAAEHLRDLYAEAAASRLLAVARCCPSVWQRGAQRVAEAGRSTVAWLRRDEFARVDNYCGAC